VLEGVIPLEAFPLVGRDTNSVKSDSPTFQLRRGIDPIREMLCYFLNGRVWANARNPTISSVALQTMKPLTINTT
jgi:hypothetical protein